MSQSCQSCRFFNRWAVAVIRYDDDDSDNRICKKNMWSLTPEMTDVELSDNKANGSTCIHYEKCKGGSNGKH